MLCGHFYVLSIRDVTEENSFKGNFCPVIKEDYICIYFKFQCCIFVLALKMQNLLVLRTQMCTKTTLNITFSKHIQMYSKQ